MINCLRFGDLSSSRFAGDLWEATCVDFSRFNDRERVVVEDRDSEAASLIPLDLILLLLQHLEADERCPLFSLTDPDLVFAIGEGLFLTEHCKNWTLPLTTD